MTTREYPARLRARIESRDTTLKALGYDSYDHYLRSPEWQALRVRHADEFGDSCGLCEVDEGIRQLHHMTYERVGQERLTDLVRLCANCHQMVHALERRGEIGLDFAGIVDMKRATVYARENERRDARLQALPAVDESVATKRGRRPGKRERMRKRATMRFT